MNLATNSDLNTVSEHANCNCLSQWVYTERICLIMLYFQCQEIATIGKYRLSLKLVSAIFYQIFTFFTEW